MAIALGICDDCSMVFFSNFPFASAGKVVFTGCKIGPCPQCGGLGSIPDGTYEMVGRATRLLEAPQRTISQLQRLKSVLVSARERGVGVEEVRREIQEELPELRSLRDCIPTTRRELYLFITMLLSVIALIIQTLSSGQKATSINIDQVINHASKQVQVEQSPPPSMADTTSVETVDSTNTDKESVQDR